MLIMIDNYDSFTYILVDYFRRLGACMEVYRHDEISVAEIAEINPEAIVISPGPKDPDHAGITIPVIEKFSGRIPLLGVCLGHQAMGQVFGGKVVRADRLMHGKTSQIFNNGEGLFKDVPSPFEATRYHSLTLEPGSLPSVLEVTAWTDQDEIMGIRHRKMAVEGVQFHPESILTDPGMHILRNFINSLNNSYGGSYEYKEEVPCHASSD